MIPHGADFRSALPVNDSKTILFFGRAAAYKGIDTLLAAMAEVWKTEPETRLRILASPGDYPPDLELDDRIHATWGGYTKHELDEELLAARAVCMPYRSASGTGVGAQAYASGRPIVASNLDGLREFVAHEELLVQPEDVLDLARALKVVLGKDYGTQAIDHERTWQGVAAAHIRAYRSLLSATAGNRAPVGRRRW